MSVFIVKLKAIWRLIFAASWAVVIVGREQVRVYADLTPNEGDEAIIMLSESVEKLHEAIEDQAQEETNVNHAQQIADGIDK